jgi:hypothetical protein
VVSEGPPGSANGVEKMSGFCSKGIAIVFVFTWYYYPPKYRNKLKKLTNPKLK